MLEQWGIDQQNPLKGRTFVGRLEEMAGRALKPQKRGPKPKHHAN
jgi:hypothetical protein